MRIFDRLDVEERELPPLPAYQTVSWEQLVSPTPGANVVEDAGVDLDDVWAADESMSRANSGPLSARHRRHLSAGYSHALTQPPPHSELHPSQHINHQLEHSWHSLVSASGPPLYVALEIDRLVFLVLNSHDCFFQVLRPLWPFFAAGGITFFLVSKAQDMGVRCASFDFFF